jgi:hypothetical protein
VKGAARVARDQCEGDEVGGPENQVIRFQVMAPTIAASGIEVAGHVLGPGEVLSSA